MYHLIYQKLKKNMKFFVYDRKTMEILFDLDRTIVSNALNM